MVSLVVAAGSGRRTWAVVVVVGVEGLGCSTVAAERTGFEAVAVGRTGCSVCLVGPYF